MSLDLRSLLARVEAAPPVAAVDAVRDVLGEALEAREVSFLIADFSGRSLIRLGHVSEVGGDPREHETAERVPLPDSPHGRALADQEVQVLDGEEGVQVLAPVTSRGEAVGALELILPARPDQGTITDVALAAHAFAYVVIANRRYTDLFEWGQRTVQFSLAAEIQHRLLPGSYTCEGGQFTLAGWLEPSAGIAGDTFDFSVERGILHLSMTDAMGHGVAASLLATVLVGSLRNSRRRGVELEEQARQAEEILSEESSHEQFVTGQLVRIDLIREIASIVNAGHPPPLRLRAGQVQEIPLHADLPFGIQSDADHQPQPLPLEAGDRIAFLTDGVLERSAPGFDVASSIASTRELHPREAVQEMVHALMEQAGGEVEDDATLLMVDWHGGPRRDRTARAGADVSGADSPPVPRSSGRVAASLRDYLVPGYGRPVD